MSYRHVAVPHGRAVVFNETYSKYIMHYAFAAFCPTPDLDAWNCTQCLDPNFKSLGVVQGEITEVYGFVGYNPVLNTIIVSFRGTDNVPNDFVDADVCDFD